MPLTASNTFWPSVRTLMTTSKYRVSASTGTVSYSIRTPSWLSASSIFGATDTSGVTITLTVNANASSLPAGGYGPGIVFTNVTNGQGSATKPAKLIIRAPSRPIARIVSNGADREESSGGDDPDINICASIRARDHHIRWPDRMSARHKNNSAASRQVDMTSAKITARISKASNSSRSASPAAAVFASSREINA
jgi:hypothetical protein